ncbi:uncharacterized protein O3C94_018556 isoform 2-T2 [Discoglossus pictus]
MHQHRPPMLLMHQHRPPMLLIHQHRPPMLLMHQNRPPMLLPKYQMLQHQALLGCGLAWTSSLLSACHYQSTCFECNYIYPSCLLQFQFCTAQEKGYTTVIVATNPCNSLGNL